MTCLQEYEALRSGAQTKLGVELPELVSANIVVTSEQCDIDDVKLMVASLSPQAGWIVYRNSVEISTAIPERDDVIEAEYVNAIETIKIKHLYGKLYSVTRFSMTNDPNESFCYSNQSLIVRGNLQEDAKLANYRLWYQKDSEGCWAPFAQQFVGFDAFSEVKEGN